MRSERLLLYTPLIALDVMASAAAGSDAEAQRWLGSRAEELVRDEGTREVLLSMRADDDLSGFEAHDRLKMMRKLEQSAERFARLTAVHAADGRYAGATSASLETGEVGGWLAPDYRGHGLGAELFGAAAQLGHRHLGLKVVRAGAEATNDASREHSPQPASPLRQDRHTSPWVTGVRSTRAGTSIGRKHLRPVVAQADRPTSPMVGAGVCARRSEQVARRVYRAGYCGYG
ncbi:GNAT family N-acetyltransferase [Streptomyces mangrovisoli]|uniref:GNAT family N-acetyltransferase n=1 Tax=Streptomyces mangrovisoli TaxID=1428628 RepID=UPI00142D49BB|nr:GNAT family N-acetyltransferase [Streptomyces mangrovisoli]